MVPEIAPTVPTNRPVANPILDVDPATLRLPSGLRSQGADPAKLMQQLSRFGRSTTGMPPVQVLEAPDGELVIYDGVTRATRVAKLLPGTPVRVEVAGRYPQPGASLPTVRDKLP